MARVHVRSWRAAYWDLLDRSMLMRMDPETRARRYTFAEGARHRTLVAEDAGVIVGFATTAASMDADVPGWGELSALYADPDHWGEGVGRLLIDAAREHLKAQGFQDAVLWVLEGNTRAERFYRRDGWLFDDLHRRERMWGFWVNTVRYRRTLDLPAGITS
ncbi:MAG TPA: GNAT family N-acetyltransferase [Caulobacteraceae bacterium]